MPGDHPTRPGDRPGYFYDDQLSLIGEPEVAGFGTAAFHVRRIPRDQANAIIKLRHYSGTVVANSYVHLGVVIAGELLGVLQFGYALNPSSAANVVEGTPNDGYLELNRMWLGDFAPKRSESRAVGCALRLIRRAWPKVRWVQSFADERCGLNGTVYQACNFVFVGEHLSPFWEIDGEVYHNIIKTAVRGKGGTKGDFVRANLDRAIKREFRQFRYLFFMAPRFARGLKLKVQPYPSATRPVDEPASSGCEPGATPGGRSILKPD